MEHKTKEAKAMYAKGYRYLIEFPDNKPEPLFVKTMTDGLKMLREDYDGGVNCRWTSLSFTHVRDVYEKLVRAVGELVLVGIWYSDACEIVWIVLDVEIANSEWWDDFEIAVNAYTEIQIREHGRSVLLPNLKRPLF